ncbi:hypothetical protein [Actinacidiphila sp. ITFR-21]|uniref:hypothetical protein n=1 Tax=Actinacidiphila sp. ITFR-21 TaxID=3075199 RepID=UPI002889E0DB|nr:hypothetical protein [Streptomyces sp. ITFR-21]WNI19188.1 hypothetical protein RLT57_29035 [Streptomyces sp. ITFR-21]
MSIHWADGTTAVTAIAGTLAAGGSWLAAKRSNRTAETLARIEQARWHADLTPKFDIALIEQGRGHARLIVHLDGPDALRRLDEVTIRVGDDDNDHTLTQIFVGAPTQEQIDAHIWGPWRFTPGSDGAGQDGRQVAPIPLGVGRGRPFTMERTRHGHWMTGMTDGHWQQQYAGQPIRLILTCRRGDEEWVVARRIDNPPLSEE